MPLTVVGVGTVLELRGISCIDLEWAAPARKGITSSRSFGTRIGNVDDLCEAVVTFVSRAAGSLSLFVLTDRHKPELPQYSANLSCGFAAETDDTRELVAAAINLTRQAFRPRSMLTNLVRCTATQQGLFGDIDRGRSAKLMAAVDEINGRYGRDALVFGAARLPSQQREWTTKHTRLSPEYTTSWAGLAVARA